MDATVQSTILAAARVLFSSQGYEGTSVRQIAAEANVNVAMISYYFGGKEALFERIVDERLGFLARRSAELLSEQKPPQDAVFAVLDAYLDEMLDHPLEYRMIVRELSNPQRGEASRLVYQKVRELVGLHMQVLAAGSASGLFRAGVDLPMVMISVIGTLFHMLNAHAVVVPMMRHQLPEAEPSCPVCSFSMADKTRIRAYLHDFFTSFVFAPASGASFIPRSS
jgi:AcrR family transcriptional regulator